MSDRMAAILDRSQPRSHGARPEDGVPNMTVISDIDENGININLRTRYQKDKIYTFTGSILVSVNPYKDIKIYEQEHVTQYSKKKISQVEPHIFAIAEAAIQNLQETDINQSCIISGESGAGKTESTKFILQYLCSVTNHTSFWTEQQILEANTVLEAFGNAKTVRNDNSSRFGKFMQVCFDQHCQIKGCIVQDYLLEQSRITFQSLNERNYHVFYQLVAGAQASSEVAQQFQLCPPESYAYLNQSGCFTLPGVDDSTMFDNLRLAMNVLNIQTKMVNGIFSVLSSILLLGNLSFEDDEGEKTVLTEDDNNILSTVCNLLGFEMDGLRDAALYRQIQVRGTVTSIPFKFQEAIENRHAMAKALYSRTFAWLVDAINKCTNPGSSQTHFIGILDIFGFENFQTNSFEQLCINYTNEKLHRFFNHYVFALEQEKYREEDIEFSHITFTDNSKCVELIEKAPRCVMKILDEECRFPKGTDKTYLNKQHQELGDHDHYLKGQDRRVWEQEFGIRHYAGIVIYNATCFLDKNKDTQQDQLFELMHNSNSEFVKDLTRFQDLLGVRLEILDGRQTISRTARNKPTVGDTFKHQLSALVDVLAVTNPWYVRCLKPNAMKKANEFVDDDVLTQLRYSGMLDIIRIKREGYPVHMNISAFLQKYGLLIGKSPLHLEEGDPRTYVKTILEELKLPKTECQIGITKVFMRNCVLEPLEDLRFQFLTIKVICIQKHWRGFWLRKGYLEKKHAVLILQFNFRCFRSRLAFLRKRKAAITIQSYMRGVLARCSARTLREEKRLDEKRRREEEQQLLRVQKVQADESSIQKTIRESQVELESLTTLIESMWTHHQPAVTPHSLDLDSMFEFLQEEKAERKAGAVDKEEALHEINEEFDVLGSLLTDAEESSDKLLHDHEIQQALAEVDKSIAEFDDRSSHENKDYALRDDRNELPSLPPPPPPLPCTNEETFPSVCMPPPPSIPPPPSPPPSPPSISEDHRLQQLPAPPQSSYQTDELLLTQNESGWKTDMDGSSVYQEIGHCVSGQISPSSTPPPPPPPPPPPRRGSTLTSVSPTPEKEEMTLPFQISFSEYESHGNEVTELSPETEEKLSQLMEQHSIDTSSSQTNDTLDKHNSSAEVDTIHDILEFAGKYFNSHIKDSGGTLMKSLKKRRQSDADRLTKGEMLTFCKSGLIPTSLVHLHDSENVTMACNVFKVVNSMHTLVQYIVHCIMADGFDMRDQCCANGLHHAFYMHELTKVMRDEMTDDFSMQIMQMIVKAGIERIALRDEIFCQLIKQTNGNPEADSLVIAWIIFCLCTAAFSPSKSLHKIFQKLGDLQRHVDVTIFQYLLSYVKMNCSDALVGKYALMCHKHLTVPRVSSRKLPPSAIEIMSVRALSPIICKVYFMDGKTKAVTVLPCDTSTELLERLAEKIGLGSVEGWAIYEVTGDIERFVRRYEYVSDILAQWEHLDRLSAQPSKYDTVNKKGPKLALGGSDAKLVFKKKVYRHVHDIPNDPVEYHLLYAEAVNKVVKLDEFSVSEKVALQLAGLQAQVIWGEYEEDKPFRYSEAEQYLTGRILASSGRNWSMEVSRAHKHFGSGKTELAAKVWYLTCVKQFPLYGCTLFPIVHRGLWSHTSDALLAVNMDGIKFVRAKDKSVITDFFFSDIESVSMDPNDNYITLELKNQIQTESPQQTYMFETSYKEDVGLLIASYSPSHASWIRMDFESMKKIKMTDEEKLKVYEEIVRCRRALSESRLLQRPLQDSSSSFLRNTLRRLTKTKLERLRTYATSSSESGQFNVNYWSYSKSPLRQALTVIHDPSVEEVAVKMFNSILVYAGIEDSSAGDSHDNTGMIQNLMLKCLENDHLCNEFYMQLIKQTTDHPDPNSQVNRRCWQLMCVAAGVMAPANTRVLKYLQVHLKKCSLDTTTEEGKFARFCFKTLSRTTEAKRRTFPPSKQEINCTIQRRPITEHIYFLNGEHRIIEFDSAAVCGELTKTVKVKIGMRSDAEGFAMYEVMSGSERCMTVDERLSDTLSKWERLSRSGAVKDLKLIFKKRLFIKPYINSGDPVECDLVFHQLLEDVFEKRKPISTQDAVHLCALKVQSEIEDMRSGEIDYSSVVRILPRDLRMMIRLEDISTTHKTVLDMSPQNAVLSFIQVLMSWQLFGATVFEVGQTYTSALPKMLLLAVDQDGIHLLESKTFREIAAYSYSEIVHSSPAIKSIMIVIGHVAKGTKFMFNTNQASQIAHLMKDYVDELQVQGLLLPTEGTQRMSRLIDMDEFERQRNSSQNTVILAQRPE